jgi:hypothetical protein
MRGRKGLRKGVLSLCINTIACARKRIWTCYSDSLPFRAVQSLCLRFYFGSFQRKLCMSLCCRKQLYIIKKIGVNFIVRTVQMFEAQSCTKILESDIVIKRKKCLIFRLYELTIYDLWFYVIPSALHCFFIPDRKTCLCCYLKNMRHTNYSWSWLTPFHSSSERIFISLTIVIASGRLRIIILRSIWDTSSLS